MNKYIKFIVLSLLSWRVLLLVIVFFSFKFLDTQKLYLGGGLENYLTNPMLWSLANFDGEHFLSIAQSGYKPLSYFFFPIYPILIELFSNFTGTSLASYLYSGIFISHLSLFIALIGLYKLLILDFDHKFSRLVVVLLLLFPTSFYFGSVYSESLFLCLCVWTFYFARKRNFLLAGILTAIATATRVVGVALIIPIIYEFIIQWKKNLNLRNVLGIFISPTGIISYMYYLWLKTGDALNFFNNVAIFGEQRQASIVLLPQVFYRYFFKIIPSLKFEYFPGYFVPILELSVAILFLIIIIFSFKKLRRSYWIFILIGYLIPTFSGSFSSLPRYVSVLFPAFIALAYYLYENRFTRLLYFVVSLLTLVVSLSLFSSGYWLS